MALFYAQDINNDGNIIAFWNRHARDLFVSRHSGLVKSVKSAEVRKHIRNVAKSCGYAYVNNALGEYGAYCAATGKPVRPFHNIATAYRVMFR